MKHQVIKIDDDLRIVAEVYCNGSIKISLEQRRQHHIGDAAWESVCFRRRPLTQDGYFIKNPDKKKAERYIAKCRKAAMNILRSRNILKKITPPDDRNKQIEELMIGIIKPARQRLSDNKDFQFTEANKQNIRRTAHSAGAYISNALLQTSQLPPQQGENTQPENPSEAIRLVIGSLAPMMDMFDGNPDAGGYFGMPTPRGRRPVRKVTKEEEPKEPEETKPTDRTDELILHEEDEEGVTQDMVDMQMEALDRDDEETSEN